MFKAIRIRRRGVGGKELFDLAEPEVNGFEYLPGKISCKFCVLLKGFLTWIQSLVK